MIRLRSTTLALSSLSLIAARRTATGASSSWQRPALLLSGGAAGIASIAANTTAEAEKAPMPMRVLGNTGLQVSVLSFGFWATFGAKPDLGDRDGIEAAKDCLRIARDAGVNLFDNAETYGNPQGEAERIMGIAIAELTAEDPVKWRRSDILITTKIFWGGPGVNEKGLSRKHVREGMDASLERLQLSHVDLVFCHRPDPLTPTETVVRAMSDVVRSGKATAWGTSEWSAQQFTEAVWIAQTLGLEPPQFEQPQYNMYHRERFESEYAPLFRPPYTMGTTIWSPLAGGLLTGKYNEGVPEGSRFTAPGYTGFQSKLQQWRESGKIDAVKLLTALAVDELGCSMAQLAIAWCLKNEAVSTVLLGATKPEQVSETLEAVAVARRLTPEQMQRIDTILGNKPEPYKGYGFDAPIRSINRL